MQKETDNASMRAPIYLGDNLSKEDGKKKGSKEKRQYDEALKRFLKELGIDPIEDEDDLLMVPGRLAYLGGGEKGMTGMMSSIPYSTPPSMMGRGGYGPMAVQPGMRSPQMPYLGDSNTSMISISYTSPDGTLYHMGVTAPQEYRGKALYNVLCGLYGLMMAEGDKSGKYSGGKGIKGYAGSSYASGGK
ncbi:hypothetical protein JW898_02610 [Candidatus Woesearchaeota archaeon]|nr:hypothetical protein [Candidatus Woesearchaeota archaeon]